MMNIEFPILNAEVEYIEGDADFFYTSTLNIQHSIFDILYYCFCSVTTNT